MSRKGIVALVLGVLCGLGHSAEVWNESVEALSALAGATGLKVYKLTEADAAEKGVALTNGIYYLDESLTFRGKTSTTNTVPGGNGLKIAPGATVYIYIPTNVTLTAKGGAGSAAARGASAEDGTFTAATNDTNASGIAFEYMKRAKGSKAYVGRIGHGASGGGAGILVPTNANLVIFGKGTLVATGGRGGAANYGGTGAATKAYIGSWYALKGAKVRTGASLDDGLSLWENYACASHDNKVKYFRFVQDGAVSLADFYTNHCAVVVGAGGDGGGGAGGGGAGIGSDGARGGLGADGVAPVADENWPPSPVYNAAEPILPSPSNKPEEGQIRIPTGIIRVFGVNVDGVRGGEGGEESISGGGNGTQKYIFSFPFFCDAAYAEAHKHGDEYDENHRIHYIKNTYFGYFDGRNGGGGGKGGTGAKFGTGGAGAGGGHGGCSGSFADSFYCHDFYETNSVALIPSSSPRGENGTNGVEQVMVADYPYNTLTFDGAAADVATTNYSLTVGTPITTPTEDADGTTVGGWEVSVAATNLPPAMGGNDATEGLKKVGAFFGAGAALGDATLGVYGNVTLTKLLYIPYDPDKANATKVYDGQPTNITVTVTKQIDGLVKKYTTDPSDPDSWSLNNPSYTDVKIDGGAVSSNKVWYLLTAPGYIPVTNFAWVTITPRSATVTAGSDKKIYDGTPLTCDKWDEYNFVTGQGIASATFDGTITDAGEVANNFSTIAYTPATLMSNYAITTNAGKLVVKPIDGAFVTVVGNTKTTVFNGKEQSVEGYASVTMTTNGVGIAGAAFNPDWVTCDKTPLAKGTNVATYQMGLVPTDFHIAEAHAMNYTNVTFSVTDGWLKIDPKNLNDPSLEAVPPPSEIYTGEGHEPTEVTVRDTQTGATLVPTTDYEIVRYANNTNVTDAAQVFLEGRGNYAGETNVLFSITKAPLTVTPEAVTLTYGDPAPTAYLYTLSGFVGGENANVLETLPVFTSSYAQGATPGTYPITVKTEGVAQNYSFSYDAANVTVKSASIVYEANPVYETYDGTNYYATVTVQTPETGAKTELSYDGGTNWVEANVSVAYKDATNNVSISYRITAENYTTATGTLEVVIARRPLTLQTADESKPYDGTPLLYTNVVADSFAPGESLDYANFNTNVIDVGTYRDAATFTWAENGTAKLSNYIVTPDYGDLTIEPNGDQIQIVSESATWMYDPARVPFKTNDYHVVNGSLFAEGDYPVVTFPETSSLAGVGEKDNAFTFIITNDVRGVVTDDYQNLTSLSGLLKVTPADLPVSSTNYVGTYDGQPHGPTVVPGVDGATVTYLSTNLFTDATNAVVTYVVSKPNYKAVTNTATVLIKPLAVQFASPSDQKPYDGTPLTFGETDVTTKFGGDRTAYPEGESFSFSDFAAITEVGSTNAAFAYAPVAPTKAANYAVTTAFGTLTVVTNDPAVVTLVATNATYVFDNEIHENHAYTALNLPAGHTIVNAKFNPGSAIRYPGSVANIIISADIVDGAGKDASRLYRLEYKPGKLTVTPREMPKATVESVTSVYDGKGHSITVTPATGLLTTPTVTYSATGAEGSFVTNNPAYVNINREDYLTYPVSYKVSATGYADDTGSGTVTITQRLITAVSQGATRAYDATPLVNETLPEVRPPDALAEGDSLATVTYGSSQTDVGKTRNLFSFAITNAAGADVTYNYAVTMEADWLEVTNLSVKVDYAVYDKTYNGKTNATFKSATFAPATLPGGETIAFDAAGMDFYFATPDVYPDIPVTAVGFDETKNLVFGNGAKRANYAVTFNPYTEADIYLAEPPALDPEPQDGTFVPGVGPYFDHNPPDAPPPAPTDPTVGTKLSNYDLVTCYDGEGHTFDTNGLFTAIETNVWIHGQYDVKYSTDAKTWSDVIDNLVFTNVVSTSFWYRVVAPGQHANYSNYYHAVGITITQRVVTVTAENKTKVYGDPDPELTCTTNNLVSGETMCAGALARTAGEDYTPTGTYYPITAGEAFDAGSNYTVQFVPGQFTITRKRADDGDVTVEKPADVYYNGKDHTPTPAATDTREGMGTIDAKEYAYSYTDNHDAGTATVTLTFTNNYEGAISTNFTILKRKVAFTSENGSWQYDGLGHGTNEVKVTKYNGETGDSGFVPDESATYDVTGSVTNVADSATNNNFFTYTLSGKAKADNYDIAPLTYGDLAITPYKIDDDARIKAHSPAARVYTGYAQEPTDVIVTDTKTLKTLVAGTDYAITGWANNTNATDAALVYVKGLGNYTNELAVTFAITQRVVTVTADDKTVKFGADAPAYTYTMTGFVTGETEAKVVTGKPALTSAYAKGVTPAKATLPIAVDVSRLSARNYSFTPANGTLTVSPAVIAYEAHKVQQTYDGADHAVSVSVLDPAEGATVEFSIDGTTWSTNSPAYRDVTNDVVVSFRIAATNYDAIASEATVEITRRPLALSTASMTKTYDGEPLFSTNVVAESYAPGETFAYSNFASQTYPGTTSASFDCAECGKAKFSNYEITTTFGTLVVLPNEKQIQVVSAGKEWTYDPNVAEYVWPQYEVVNSNLFATGDYPLVTFDETARLTGVGAATNSFTLAITNDARGDVTAEYADAGMLYTLFGDLKVTPAKLDVTVTNYVGYYDAQPHQGTIATEVKNVTTNYLTEYAFTDVTNATVRFELTAPNYIATTGSVEVTIRPIPVTYTSVNKQMAFKSGAALAVTAADVTASDDIAGVTFPDGQGFDVVQPFAKLSEIGVTNATFSLKAKEGTTAANYAITRRYGLLTMYEEGEKILSVIAKSATYRFTGETFTNNEWEVVSTNVLAEGHYVTNVVFDPKSVVTYPSEGNVANRIESFQVFDRSGNNVTTNYTCRPLEGRLNVLPITRPLHQQADAEPIEAVYDGTGYSIKVMPDPANTYISGTTPTIFYSETGEEGSFVTNNPAYTYYNENPYKVYYKVTAPGYEDETGSSWVRIKRREVAVESKGREREYNGLPLIRTYAAETAGNYAEGDVATYRFPNSQIDAGATENLFGCAITNAAGKDVTVNYDLRKTPGKLQVMRFPMSLTFDAADKVYDGTTDAVSTSSGKTSELVVPPSQEAESLTFVTNGMSFAFADPNVGAGKTVTAYGFDETNNIIFAANTRRGNYAITFTPTNTASIIKAGPPDIDSDTDPTKTGPFTDEDVPNWAPPAATNGEGQVTTLSKYDTVIPYDGFGHTFDTNSLFAAIETKEWLPGVTIKSGDYGVTYSYDGVTWTNNLVAFTFTNTVSTSLWYWVKTPFANPNFSNYVHAVGLTITQRVSTITYTADNKPYDGTTDATCVATNFANLVTNALGTIESFTLDTTRMTFAFDTPDVGSNKTVTAFGYDDSLVEPGEGTLKSNYTFAFVTNTTANIGKQKIDGFTFDGATTNCYYIGKGQEPAPVVTNKAGDTLPASDYETRYFNNTNATTDARAEVTLTNPNYEGVLTNSFAIKPRVVEISTEGTNFTYLAKAQSNAVSSVSAWVEDPASADPADHTGFVAGEGIVTNGWTELTDVPSAPVTNVLSYALAPNTLAGNYAITHDFGRLTMEKGSIVIPPPGPNPTPPEPSPSPTLDLYAQTVETTYNGAGTNVLAQVFKDGQPVTGFTVGYSASPTGPFAADYALTNAYDAAGNVTSQKVWFVVLESQNYPAATNYSWVTIKPFSVTVRSNDGGPWPQEPSGVQSNATVTFSAELPQPLSTNNIVCTDFATVSLVELATNANTFSWHWAVDAASAMKTNNYTVTPEYGRLVVILHGDAMLAIDRLDLFADVGTGLYIPMFTASVTNEWASRLDKASFVVGDGDTDAADGPPDKVLLDYYGRKISPKWQRCYTNDVRSIDGRDYRFFDITAKVKSGDGRVGPSVDEIQALPSSATMQSDLDVIRRAGPLVYFRDHNVPGFWTTNRFFYLVWETNSKTNWLPMVAFNKYSLPDDVFKAVNFPENENLAKSLEVSDGPLSLALASLNLALGLPLAATAQPECRITTFAFENGVVYGSVGTFSSAAEGVPTARAEVSLWGAAMPEGPYTRISAITPDEDGNFSCTVGEKGPFFQVRIEADGVYFR